MAKVCETRNASRAVREDKGAVLNMLTKSLILAGVLMTAAAGTVQAASKLNVVTATEDLAAISREIGGDKINVDAIARGYQDPHFVEPKPSFLLKLQKADLLEVVGLQPILA